MKVLEISQKKSQKKQKSSSQNDTLTKKAMNRAYLRLSNYQRVLYNLQEESFIVTKKIHLEKDMVLFVKRELEFVAILLGIIRKTLDSNSNFNWICDSCLKIPYWKMHRFMLNGMQPKEHELIKMISFINN